MTGKIILTMLAFAANSVICRLALTGQHIDPASFSNLRLMSGALFLGLLILPRRGWSALRFNAGASLSLALYVMAMSWSYLQLDAGAGALLLFGTVQIAMIVYGWRRGERPGLTGYTGLAVAMAGTLLLLLPGASAPSPVGALFMVISGLAWAFYTVAGKKMTDAVASTAGNFILAVPVCLIATLIIPGEWRTDAWGVLAAVTSGACASAGAYMLWYSLLPSISATFASTVQLSVPCIAALGGVLLLGETFSLQMLLSMLMVLAGIGLVIVSSRSARKMHR